MLTKDMTRAPGQTESFLLSWTCSYQNPFRLCLPSCVSAPLSQTRLCYMLHATWSVGQRASVGQWVSGTVGQWPWATHPRTTKTVALKMRANC